MNASEIIRITINHESGYGLIEKAFEERITIEENSIKYKYKPVMESITNRVKTWSSKQTNQEFQDMFHAAAEAIVEIMEWENVDECMDVGRTNFVLTFADGSKISKYFFLPCNDFEKCFALIRRMIPLLKAMPQILDI